MSGRALPLVLYILIPALAALGLFLVYLWLKYSPIVGRIFEETPVLQPLKAAPCPDGQDVRFPTAGGLELSGTYYAARTPTRAGVIVFCHEFLGDSASASIYADPLRDLGFDLFAFDFRNHGRSDSEPGYDPLQWVSNRETRDVKAALAYVRARPDADPAGVGLFGVSRGGSAAICVAARDPRVWAVATDGAFPTRGTMNAYIERWAEIYVRSKFVRTHLPKLGFYRFVGWAGRMRTAWRLDRRFPDVERAIARISPRPLLMIHGERDAYIGPDIARTFFDLAGEPKRLWLVPGAKHNRCREVDPEGYRDHLERFFRRASPRRTHSAPSASSEDQELACASIANPI